MAENNINEVHSAELFNTDDLMQSEEINFDGDTEEIVPNSEDHETQINNEINQLDSEDHDTEIIQDAMETDEHAEEDEHAEDSPENNTEEAAATTANNKKVPKPNVERLTQLPLSKVKHIIKLDPEVKLVNSDAVYLVTKTTEMFIKTLAKEAFGYAAQNKKKTITKSHVEQALSMLPVEL